MPTHMPFWAREQLALRTTFDGWITQEIDRYQAEGFQRLFGEKGGHALDEAGGYTRSFVSGFCLSGDARIVTFMKQFRDDWHRAVTEAGHFWHGYDSNENGDYITHTAEAFTQFLLNVLYLDIFDSDSVEMIEDAAEHLGNWNADVQDWYDWDRHVFLSYFLGTRSPYHHPAYSFQSTRHFRVLTIASAAYEATGKARYLDLCRDYCGFWSEHIASFENDRDISLLIFLLGADEILKLAEQEPYKSDWRFLNYHKHVLDPPPGPAGPPGHNAHDLIMTWLDLHRFTRDAGHAAALRRVMARWVAADVEARSLLVGSEPNVSPHLLKYRDYTKDTCLDDLFLERYPRGIGSYMLTGDVERLEGCASVADSALGQALVRNAGSYGKQYTCDHSCSVMSNSGASTTYVMPALFMPTLGGLGVHSGRAPWVNVLYYTDGHVGLPADVAALYVPAGNHAAGVKLANAGKAACTIAVRHLDPMETKKLVLTAPPAAALPDVHVQPGEIVELPLE